jgi:glyoxylase-like metal-dependent hydrolase (beta-lactamase superfamily II)
MRLPLLIAAILSLGLAATASAQEAKRSFTKVRGDVYRFQNNFHYSLVVKTEVGIVVVDPINAEAAAALKKEISIRFNQPIIALIYSHSDGDHASGGKALDAAMAITHENAPADIDGIVPDIRFSKRMETHLGGKTFELTYLGEGHAKDLIAVVVRPENVAFIVDAASPKRLPFRDFPRSDVGGWIDQVKVIETLEFEVFAPGHGNLGVKSDATDARVYMEELRDQVLAGLNAGKSVEELSASVTMDKYKDWGSYDSWRALNVQGMARWLKESGQAK